MIKLIIAICCSACWLHGQDATSSTGASMNDTIVSTIPNVVCTCTNVVSVNNATLKFPKDMPSTNYSVFITSEDVNLNNSSVGNKGKKDVKVNFGNGSGKVCVTVIEEK